MTSPCSFTCVHSFYFIDINVYIMMQYVIYILMYSKYMYRDTNTDVFFT